MPWKARASHIYCALPELTKTHNYNLPVQSTHHIFQLATWSVEASGGRNERAKFGCRALNTFRVFENGFALYRRTE